MRSVFLTGTGRSGTTVLRKCLSHHPEVATMPGELRVIIDPSGILDVYEVLAERWDPYRADTVIWRFNNLLNHVSSFHTSEYRQHDTDKWTGGEEWYKERVSKLIDDITIDKIPAIWTGATPDRQWMYETRPWDYSYTLVEFIEDLYRKRNPDAHVFVEDTPYTACHARTINKVFEDPLFVFCARHPRDIYSSFLHGGKHWTPKDPMLAANRIAYTIEYSIDKIKGFSHFTWRLEDMMENPSKQFDDLCNVLEINPAHTGKLVQPLDQKKAHRNRAEDELSEEEIDIYDMVLSSWTKELGYDE